MGRFGQQLRSTDRRRSVFDYAVFGVLAFIPLLVAEPGVVTDDTKTYLYLDPGRYVRQAVSLWDPNVALGTVTHENIGYLLPMGPFYWLLAELHVPLWMAQRLWLGCLLFAAGAGMLYLCRTIGLTGPGRYVASLAFMFTPYLLQYTGRISVILMPWSGLPWMTAFVILALRRGGWKYPALFALVVALVSGINASSILYVGIGPALWLPFAVFVLREATGRQAWRVALKVGLLSALVSLWWAIGLQVEAAYGVNILKYTETLISTSGTSTPAEVLRGLGYWFFYGASDQTGNWTQSAVAYTQHLWLLALTFLVPALAFVAAAVLRWRLRAYFILLVVVGTVLAVGPYPYSYGTPVSTFLKDFMSETTAGLALRSTDRASPLLLLGLAVLLGAGVTALAGRMRWTGWMIGGLAGAAVIGASAPLWTSGGVVNGLSQPATPPAYVRQAANTLNHTHPGTRVYAMPGNNFAAYRWGDTIDTVYPALLTRPFVTHEQQTMGSLPTADLLEAVDTPLQDGTLNTVTIAPMASLMSAGDVLVQYDQQYERYDSPDPQQLAQDLTPTPPGLSDPVSYGTPRPNISTVSHLDEQTLARPANQKLTAPLVSYTVANPRPINRAESLTSPVVVDGNADGLVAAAGVGLLAGNPTLLYAGTLDTDKPLATKVLASKPNLVVTDTNRKQGYRWNGIIDNAGYTETRTQPPDNYDPTDAPLNLFPGAPADAQSTAVFNGISQVTASSYGSPSLYYPYDRPAAALDGSMATAWVTAQFPVDQWWQVRFDKPKTIDHINLATSGSAHFGEQITKVTLTFDNQHPYTVKLGSASLTAAGQNINFPTRTFTTLRITIDAGHLSRNHYKAGFENTTGLAEVRIPGVHADEAVSMPQDLLRAAGPSSAADPLTLIMTRERASGYPPQIDTELTLARDFWLPTARTFNLTGTARLSPLASDATIDAAIGRSGSVTASTSSRMAGDVASGADAAIDGDQETAWQSAFGAVQQGQWLQYQLATPITVDSLNLKVLADGRHSLPTQITVSADGSTPGTGETVTLPSITDSRVAGSVVDVPVQLPRALTGSTIRVTFSGVRQKTTINYYTQTPTSLPLGIAELGIPGLSAGPVPTTLPDSCRNDLLTVDGSPVWISVTGPSTTALARNGLNVALCGPDASGLTLGAGAHALRSTGGQTVGIDLDQLALASSPGGTAAPISAGGQVPAPVTTPAPTVKVVHQNSTSMQLTVAGVTPTTSPFELVMGQSINAGWKATVGGHSLGAPVLIDGFANGWEVQPAQLASAVHSGQLTVLITWTPQREVNVALIISALSILGCLVLAFVPFRRRRRAHRRRSDSKSTTAPLSVEEASLLGESVSLPEPLPEPELVTAYRSEGGATSVGWAVWIGILTGVAAFLIASPLLGVVVGVATGVAMRFPKTRLALGIVAATAIVGAGGYVVIDKAVRQILPNGGWPTAFGPADSLVWVGMMFIGADAVVEVMTRHLARLPGATPLPTEDGSLPPTDGPELASEPTGSPDTEDQPEDLPVSP